MAKEPILDLCCCLSCSSTPGATERHGHVLHEHSGHGLSSLGGHPATPPAPSLQKQDGASRHSCAHGPGIAGRSTDGFFCQSCSWPPIQKPFCSAQALSATVDAVLQPKRSRRSSRTSGATCRVFACGHWHQSCSAGHVPCCARHCCQSECPRSCGDCAAQEPHPRRHCRSEDGATVDWRRGSQVDLHCPEVLGTTCPLVCSQDHLILMLACEVGAGHMDSQSRRSRVHRQPTHHQSGSVLLQCPGCAPCDSVELPKSKSNTELLLVELSFL